MGDGMRKLWVVITREYAERVRTRWFIVATVLGPLFFAGILFLPAYLAARGEASADVKRIAVLDATGTTLGRDVATELSGGAMGDTSLTRIVTVASAELARAESLAVALVRGDSVKGYLVLDAATLAGRSARYVGTNASASLDMQRIDRVVTQAVRATRLEQAGVSPDDAATLAALDVKLDAQRLTADGRGGSGMVSALFGISVAVLLYFTILLYGQNVLRGVMEEKQTRVAEVVISSVSPTTLLAGKVLGVGAVGLTQQVLWIGAAAGLFQARGPVLARFGIETTPVILPAITPGMIAVLLLFFVLGYAFYAAIFAAVGAMVTSEQEAQQAQMPVIMLLVATIVMLQPVLQQPDSTLARVLSLLAFSAPIIMPMRMSTVDVPAWEIALSLSCTLVACALAVWAAAKIYRTGLLLYGKRPSVRELVRWVRTG